MKRAEVLSKAMKNSVSLHEKRLRVTTVEEILLLRFSLSVTITCLIFLYRPVLLQSHVSCDSRTCKLCQSLISYQEKALDAVTSNGTLFFTKDSANSLNFVDLSLEKATHSTLLDLKICISERYSFI
jgi:hypothetical protein